MATKARTQKDEYKNICKQAILERAYTLQEWNTFDYSHLKYCPTATTKGKKPHTVNTAIVMFDTETTKLYDNPVVKDKIVPVMNAVVAFTVSIRCFQHNIVTLYGHKPSELTACLSKIRENLVGDKVICFAHNLAYDYTFCRRFFFRSWKEPIKQLSTKPHYPIAIEFDNGIVLRDSLCIAQRKLERWAEDMKCEHLKASGKWDYSKRRTQNHRFNGDELEYIEHDTLAGVECLDLLRESIGVETLEKIYTATGISRRDVKKLGLEHKANYLFRKCVPNFDTYQKLLQAYHGAMTHADRSLVSLIIRGDVWCKDFTSSYPFVMCSEKYAMYPFVKVCDCKPEEILELKEDFCFVFKFTAKNIRLKEKFFPMPALQKSRAVELGAYIEDNGRLLQADYYSCYMLETDLEFIMDTYEADEITCTEVEYSEKDYLPRWFTDYVYQLFYDKSTLKGVDNLLYALQKGKLNSLYGMCAMKSIRDEFIEDYATGLYSIKEKTQEEIISEYEKYTNSRSNVLLFQWGCEVTSYAYRNLFRLGKCVDFEHGGYWIYSDTDSIYSNLWNEEKVNQYNAECIRKMSLNNYEPVCYNGKEYKLGIATPDAHYTEFVTLGAKKYCGRSAEDNELHITVAGVPKSGAIELNDDIHNFKTGMVFHGTTTDKLTHYYLYHDIAEIDGYEVADSIDLNPCDYLLSEIDRIEDFLNYDTIMNLYE